ncbi:hypothetical protein [Pseudonocardia acaciae]|uniref:hypothetical protein n=1 Tax=Pseudonocardia acaciae TaxID=551276 RepID=UPI000AAB4323|nr:hypothetical protein [Pseudonocardia acaciae]
MSIRVAEVTEFEADELFDLDPKITFAPSAAESLLITENPTGCGPTGCHTISRTYCGGC